MSPKPEWRKSALQPNPDLPTTAEPSKSYRDGVAASKTRSIQQVSFVDMACPTAHVSAFCRAIISKVIPEAFWGGDHNKHIVMYWVDQFVNVRRFESFTLHQVTQKIQVCRFCLSLYMLKISRSPPSLGFAHLAKKIIANFRSPTWKSVQSCL